MGEARKLRGERIVAWTVVFIVHALLGWTLIRVPTPLRVATTTGSALDLVWVAAPRSVPPARHDRARSVATRQPATSPAKPAQRDSPASSVIRDTREPATAQPLSAVFIRQAVELAAGEPPGTFQADPFANRTVRLPGRAANRFRMRTAPSLAERVAKVGKLFGGADYETDPCRSVSKSINDLSQEGDSRVLQDALDYERRHCR